MNNNQEQKQQQFIVNRVSTDDSNLAVKKPKKIFRKY